MLLIERADFQGDGGRFSFSVAVRRQTAANFSALFQMAALCRDAASRVTIPKNGRPRVIGREMRARPKSNSARRATTKDD